MWPLKQSLSESDKAHVFAHEVTDESELLKFSLRQEGVLVPHVVRCCVEEVEHRGLDEVGIYRISGATNDINELKTAFDSSKETNVTLLKKKLS